jgi:hypothetical protein
MAPDVKLVVEDSADPSEATVDNITLVENGDAKSLTSDQYRRLKATGAKLVSSDEEQGDEFDQLKGKDLNDQAKAAGVDPGLGADEKRDALRKLAAGDDTEGGER